MNYENKSDYDQLVMWFSVLLFLMLEMEQWTIFSQTVFVYICHSKNFLYMEYFISKATAISGQETLADTVHIKCFGFAVVNFYLKLPKEEFSFL